MNLINTYLIIFSFLVLTACSSKSDQTANKNESRMKVIFDTDMGNDIDDALALDMLYKYIDEGTVNLLGIVTNKDNKYSAEYIDIMSTWYGYPDIPIGIIHDGADSEHDAINYAEGVCLMETPDGEYVFKRSIEDHSKLPEAHILYRDLLAQQPDSSVTIISVGFSTNLARLLDTSADDISPLTGEELVSKKVKLLCTMAGSFSNENLFEYNVVKDIPSAQKVFSEWPTRLVTSPFEVGIEIEYPSASIENDFKWTQMHPMIEAYKIYQEMPYDRPTWDLTSVLYSVEGDSLFNVSPAGKIKVTDNGGTSFTADPQGNRYYLTVDSTQVIKIKQRFIDLISKQPKHLQK